MAEILENTTTKTLLQDELSREADFRVGIVATKKVVPNLNISFDCASGAEKYFINLNRRGVTVGAEKETYVADKLSLKVGDETDIWYLDSDGNFKWDIEYATDPRPSRGVDHVERWELTFSPGLRFLYQDTLENDWAENNMGMGLAEYLAVCTRPDKVVGSYAVYADKKNHIRRPDGSTIANYATGKLAHIYRPLCIDAVGKKVWGILKVEGGELSITMPAAFLDTATFPVTLDPTIGYTTGGASNNTVTNSIRASRFASDGAGDANPGTFYVYGHYRSSNVLVAGVYADNSGTAASQSKLSNSDPIITLAAINNWRSGSIIWTGIAAGTDYWLAFNAEDAGMCHDTGIGYQDMEFYARTYDGTMPATFDASPSSNSWTFSIYIDYTAGGGDVNVNCTVDALTLTEYPATVNVETNVQTNLASLALTENQAAVNAETNVQAGVDSLILSALAATIDLDVNIAASVDTLILTEYQASVTATAAAVSPDGAARVVTCAPPPATVVQGSRIPRIINDPRAPKIVKK